MRSSAVPVPPKTMATLQLRALQTRHLKPVDLIVDGGQCVCLSGASGSGKSLLLRAIADLDPHGGEVLLDGVPSERIPAPQWRRAVGLLAARSHWWAPRVGDHFPGDGTSDLEALGFGSDVLSWSVERLSSGERQRLALLRLLRNQPKALLLDEPTANLDPQSERRVEAWVGEYCQRTGAAVLWVSHDPEQVRRVCQRALRLSERGLESVT